jgi:hypothetical protein
MDEAARPPVESASAERTRRYRARLKGDLPPVERLECPACGKSHTGARGPLCCRCWERLTEEGRVYKRQRVADTRARAKARKGGG